MTKTIAALCLSGLAVSNSLAGPVIDIKCVNSTLSIASQIISPSQLQASQQLSQQTAPSLQFQQQFVANVERSVPTDSQALFGSAESRARISRSGDSARFESWTSVNSNVFANDPSGSGVHASATATLEETFLVSVDQTGAVDFRFWYQSLGGGNPSLYTPVARGSYSLASSRTGQVFSRAFEGLGNYGDITTMTSGPFNAGAIRLLLNAGDTLELNLRSEVRVDVSVVYDGFFAGLNAGWDVASVPSPASALVLATLGLTGCRRERRSTMGRITHSAALLDRGEPRH